MKPTVFNYQEYERVVEENKKLKAEVANLQIRCRIAESDKQDRNCEQCKHHKADGCSRWECEYEPRMSDLISINQQDFGTLCICAIRYCHGRKTYMPSLVMEIVGKHLSELSDRDIKVMYDDCRFMNLSDYGDEVVDKPKWLLWKKKLKQELKRREVGE